MERRNKKMNNLSRERKRRTRMRDVKAERFKLKDFLPESVVEKLNALRKEKGK